MGSSRTFMCAAAVAAIAALWQWPVAAVEAPETLPETQEKQGPPPAELVKELAQRQPPPLVGKGEEARRSASSFLAWAAASNTEQAELVRKAVAEARDKADIQAAFCEEAFELQRSDHSLALVALALLGEARSPQAAACLTKFVAQPLPEKGTVVEGEILEQTALAALQAKAIDGLAYSRTSDADSAVLKAAAGHPSRIVRAEAIAAYLYNHDDSAEARKALSSVIRPDEQIFLDRPVRRAGQPKESFNRNLEQYLKMHPEVIPPPPEKAAEQPEPVLGEPPSFSGGER
jgi:hypothetical protein